MKDSMKPYWATLPEDEIADEIIDRVEKYYEHLNLTGRLDLYRRSWAYYYRPRMTGAKLNPSGQQGELTTIAINQFRNLLVHLETMTTQQRPAFEPRATNTDSESMSQVILAKGLLDYYMKEKKLERFIKQAVKDALIFGEGFIKCEWDPTSGEVYGKTETGAPVHEGDIKYQNYMPLNAIRDFTKQSSSDEDWVITRDFENKYILANKFPSLSKEILEDSAELLTTLSTTTLNALSVEESDNIPVYRLVHKPTPAIPQGRYTLCLDNGTVLMDGPLPYTKTHFYRIAPDEEAGSIFGFTVAYDLLPIQEAYDMVNSTIVTNQATFGVQNILVPKGHDLSTAQLSGGLNVMEFDPKVGEPKALILCSTAPEIFNYRNELVKEMETISGVNSVARGNPEASLKSGAALALVQSQAVQFSMNLQQSYAQLAEDLGTATIDILKQFAAVPRVAAIAGKANRPLMKQFSGDDLGNINRVLVDLGNPLTNMTSGKLNLADQLLERGMIEDPDQYIQVLTTGRLEPVIQGKQMELRLIQAENEKLSDGVPVRAIITDQHAQHILEHKCVMASPEARENPNDPIVVNTLNHIQEHINFLNVADPALLALIHQQSLAPMMPPQGAPGQSMNPATPAAQEAQNVELPQMPSPPAGTDPRSAEIIESQKGPIQ